MKKIISIILSLAILCSCVFVTGMFSSSAEAKTATYLKHTLSLNGLNSGVHSNLENGSSGVSGLEQKDFSWADELVIRHKASVAGTYTVHLEAWVGSGYTGKAVTVQVGTDWSDVVIPISETGWTEQKLSEFLNSRLYVQSNSTNSATYDFEIIFRSVESSEPEKTEVLQAQTTASWESWGWDPTYTTTKTFDQPKDMSGSDGKLVVKHTGATWTGMYLTLYTKNKTTEKVQLWWNDSVTSTTWTTRTFDLQEKFGLSDSDLACVTGYAIEIGVGDDGYSPRSLTYEITIPKPLPTAEKSTVLQEQKSLTFSTNYWSGSEVNSVDFETPKDMSGSNGKIILKHSSSVDGSYLAVWLTVKTANKTTAKKELFNNVSFASGWHTYEISITDMGLTDDDLSYVTGYTIEVASGNAPGSLTFTYEITVPERVFEIEETDTLQAETTKSWTTNDWWTPTYTEKIEFINPKNLSGSDGKFVVRHKGATWTGMYLTLYTKNKTTEKVQLWWNESATSSTWTRREFDLSKLGLTDNDLAFVTGYSIEIGVGDSVGSVAMTYDITFPKPLEPAIETDTLADRVSFTNVNAYGSDWTEGAVALEQPIDLSGAVDGKLYIEYEQSNSKDISTKLLFALQLTTLNGTTGYKETNGYIEAVQANKKCYWEVPLSSLGLTDEDLKYVTDYSFKCIQHDDSEGSQLGSGASNVRFSITNYPTEKNSYLGWLRGQLLADATRDGADCIEDNSIDIRDIMAAKIRVKQWPLSIEKWQQEGFYLSTNMVTSATNGDSIKAIDFCKDLGLNMVEVYSIEEVEYCQQVGMKAILRLSRPGNYEKSYEDIWEAIMAKGLGDTLVGYEVYGEPDTNETLAAAEQQIKIANTIDPSRLAYVYLMPSYVSKSSHPDTIADGNNFVSYVQKYLDDSDPEVLGVDHYSIYYKTNGTTGDYWRDMGVMRSQSIKENIPFWFYYESVNILEPTTCDLSRSQISYGIYTGLAYGAKMLSSFLTPGYAYSPDGSSKTDRYDEAKALYKEAMNMGNELYDKKQDAIYHLDTAGNSSNRTKFNLDDKSSSTLFSCNATKSVIVSQFSDAAGNKYLMFTNKSASSQVANSGFTSWSVTLKSSMKVELFDAASGTYSEVSASTTTINPTIPAGGAVLYKLS